jgi:hypothetical protein
MKAQHFFYFIIITILFSACKKDKYYCDKWTGDWDFVTIKNSWQMDWPQPIVDTLYYVGKIHLGNEENLLLINYFDDYHYIVKVNKEGSFSEGLGSEYVNGQFEGEDKVHIETRHGGLGGYVRETINGIKITKGGRK